MAGCTPIYNPEAAQAPIFRDAGEVHPAAHTGTNGIDAQTAVNPPPRPIRR